MNFRGLRDAEVLRAKGVVPMLAIVRVGEKADDISYSNIRLVNGVDDSTPFF